MERIAVVGASGLAKIVIDIVETAKRFTIAGLIDAERAVGTTFFGYSVIGRDEDVPRLFETKAFDAAVIAIGDNWRRHQVAERLMRFCPRLEFPSAFAPSAHVGRGASIGRGTIAAHGVAIGADTRVGEFAFFAFGASVGHDCAIGDFATLGSSAAIAGGASLGAFSILSIGASIIHGVSVGAHTVIGAGATVVSDLGDHVVALGTPAAVARRRQTGDAYL